MKRWMLMALAFVAFTAHAHGPSGQKVVKEVVIKAAPEKVWQAIKQFDAIKQWHPNIAELKLEDRKDAETGNTLPFRAIKMKDGVTLLEKLREASDEEMKIDYKLVDGAESSIAVSNYRSVMQVKAGPGAGESTVTWTARFYNKANTMEAPAGQDNPAANAAINSFYNAGAEGLKAYLEKK